MNYGETIVKVLVGIDDEQKIFPVHKNLLCAVSELFEQQLNCPWFTCSREMTFAPNYLRYENPCTFEVLQRWIYSGKVDNVSSYAGGDDLHEDEFWLGVYLLSEHLKVRAVQVIAFERFETVLPCKKPIVLPSMGFIEKLYDNGESAKALQVYVSRHSAYWMLRSLKKAEKWTTLLEVDERYGMDTLKWISKLLPMQAREPESFNRQHPAYSRGQFAIEYNLDLQTLRKEANDRMRATKCDVTRRPQLGMLCNPFLCNADFKAETVIDSQSQDDQISPISSPRHGKQNDQVPVPDINRPRKRIRTSLKTIDSTVVDHTIEEESL